VDSAHRGLNPSPDFGPPPPLSASWVGKPRSFGFFSNLSQPHRRFPSRSFWATPSVVEVRGSTLAIEKCRCADSFPPPRRHPTHTVSVRFHSCARRLSLLLLELPPLVPPHLVTRLDAGSRATVGVPCAVTTRGVRRSAGRARPPFGLVPD
jgi:hypothetical protein